MPFMAGYAGAKRSAYSNGLDAVVPPGGLEPPCRLSPCDLPAAGEEVLKAANAAWMPGCPGTDPYLEAGKLLATIHE
jgi:hypothetical protein